MSCTLNAESFSEINILERTSLNEGASAGSSTLKVASTQGLGSGQPVFVGTPARDGCEAATVNTVVNANTVSLTAPLSLPHSAYEPVVAVIGGSIRIYRAANVDGTAPADDAFEVLVVHAIDPDQQTTYYTDPDGSSDWFWLTLREAAAAPSGPPDPVSRNVVLSELWVVSAVAGFCFRTCRRW